MHVMDSGYREPTSAAHSHCIYAYQSYGYKAGIHPRREVGTSLNYFEPQQNKLVEHHRFEYVATRARSIQFLFFLPHKGVSSKIVRASPHATECLRGETWRSGLSPKAK